MRRNGVSQASEAGLKLVRGGYGGLRGWIDQVEKMGELVRVNGASWDAEMGAITHMLTEHSHGTAPALLFDEIPGYPKGYRTLYGHFSSVKRVALTLGLPLERERKIDIVKQYYDRIQTMKVVVLVGQDPLLFMLAASPLPEGISELDFAGGLRGEPIEVIRGPYTGFPIPADAEIAIEAEAVPGHSREEGPFGEWMGYYSDDTVARPYLDIKTILHRNNPILTCAPQHKPVDETGLLKGIAGAAQVWRALEACGLPDILGVWNHEAGPATRFTAIQIKQRYPGHARNVLHVACSCQGGAYAGKWTVVVDEDIDAGDRDQVLWAMCTRFDPLTDIDMIQKAWASKRDPLYLPGNFNNRILIDACIPYDRN